MFITFIEKEDYFLDNLKNGFLLREHSVTFDTANPKIFEVVINFWKEYKITGPLITYMIDLHNKYGECNQHFSTELINHLDSNNTLKQHYYDTFNALKTNVKMKCFTEIRDNQKINEHHTTCFGEY